MQKPGNPQGVLIDGTILILSTNLTRGINDEKYIW
jgi:hypothetical protein